MWRIAGRAIAQCWPALLAWFFAGWLGHTALVRLAGYAGNYDALWGLLILPLAVIVKLASYVGMFLALRSALHHFDRLDSLNTSTGRRWGAIVVSGMLPFLVIYVAWGMISDDLLAYGDASWDQYGNEGAANTPYSVSIGVMSVTFVIVTFALRFLIGRLSKRLPAWSGAIAAYLEAAWLLTAVIAVTDLLAGVPEWFASRRMFGWLIDAIADLRDAFAWFAVVGDAIGWVIAAAGDVLVQPLAWLALAGIVYASALPRRPVASNSRAARIRATASRRWGRLPRPIRRLGQALSGSILERWRPISSALSLIWRNGPLDLGMYILAFAIVTAGGEWITMLIHTVLGPHEIGWWIAADDPLRLLSAAISVPLQIVIVAAAFDHSLKRLDEQVVSADAELAEVLHGS